MALHWNRIFTHRNQFPNKLICGDYTKQKQNNNNNNNYYNKSIAAVFVVKQPVFVVPMPKTTVIIVVEWRENTWQQPKVQSSMD